MIQLTQTVSTAVALGSMGAQCADSTRACFATRTVIIDKVQEK